MNFRTDWKEGRKEGIKRKKNKRCSIWGNGRKLES